MVLSSPALADHCDDWQMRGSSHRRGCKPWYHQVSMKLATNWRFMMLSEIMWDVRLQDAAIQVLNMKNGSPTTLSDATG